MTLSKKIFLTSTIALIVLLLFWGIYNLSFKRPALPTQTTSQQSKQADVSAVQNAPEVSAISDEAVLAPTLSSDSQHIEYYSKKTGETYEINFDGTGKQTVSTEELPGLSYAIWSPDDSKVIRAFPQGSYTKFVFHDYAAGDDIALGNGIDWIAWLNNNKIIYKYYDQGTKENSLNISNPDGSNWLKITDLKYSSMSLAPIPKTGLVSFWNSPDANTATDFESISALGGDATPLIQNYFGADYLWSPDGTNILMSHTDQQGGNKITLAVTDSQGNNYKDLGVATFVSKCAWSVDDKTVYCAVPDSLPDDATLPNDYSDGKITTSDSFWKINTETGDKTIIAGPNQLGGKFDASNLFLNLNESSLFFINNLDGKLYKIDL